jgi:predicted Zn-dependent protease
MSAEWKPLVPVLEEHAMTGSRRPARINWKLLVILAAAVVVLGVGAFVAREVRKQYLANRGLTDGQAAYQQGDWKGAATNLREYLERFPDNPEVLEQYARANLLVRPLEPSNVLRAIDAYRRVLRLKPGDPSSYKPLATLYAYTGNPGEMAHIAKMRLEQAPDDPEAQAWLARSLLAQDDREKRQEARTMLEKLVEKTSTRAEKSPQVVRACLLLAGIATRGAADATAVEPRQAKAAALRWLDRAIQYDPRAADAYVARARMQLLPPLPDEKAREDALAKAKKDLEQADGLQFSDPRVRLDLAGEWLRHGQLDRSEAELKAVDAMLVPVRDSEGKVAAYRLGDEKAPLAYEIVDPNDLVVAKFGLRAEMVALKRAAADGVALANEALAALKSRPHRVAVLPTAIELYAVGDKVAEARACFDEYLKATQAQPVPEPRERVAWLEALVAQAEGKPGRVVAVLEPVTTAGTKDPRTWMVLARAYRQTGQPQLAARALGECHRLAPQTQSVTAQLVREYADQGRWSEALQAASEAEKLAPDSPVRLLRIEAAIALASEQAGTAAKTELDKLASELADLRKKNEKLAQIRILQAAIAVSQDRLDDAQRLLSEAISECPETETLGARLALAQVHARKKQMPEALRVCRDACDKHKQRAAPWLAMAEVLVSDKKYNEARAALEEGLKAVEGLEGKRDLRFRAASLEIADAEGKVRVDLAKDLARKDTDDARIPLLLLQLPGIRSDEALAQVLIGKIREIQGENSLLWRLHQTQLWLSQNQWRSRQKEIADALGRCMTADPKWSAPVLLLAAMDESLNDLDGAEALYRRALTSNPAATDVADRLMVLLERRGRFADAKAVLDQVGRGAGILDAHRWRVAYGQGNMTQAMADLQLRVTHDPRDAASRIDLARLVYEQKKDLPLALKYLAEAESIAPESIIPIAVKVAILEKEGRRDEARRALDEKVKASNTLAAYLLRADFLASIGEAALAEKDYVHLTTLETSGDGHLRLARFYSDAGQWDKAIRALEDGIKAYPANLPLRDRLMRAMLTRNAEGDRDRATRLLTELEQRRPDDPGVLGVRALLLLAEGKTESTQKAQQLLERVIQLAPTAVDAHLALFGLAMDRLDVAGARDIATRAMEANPDRKELILARAEAERRLGNPGMAKELVGRLLKQSPDDADVLNALISLVGNPPDAKAMEEAKSLVGGALKGKPTDERLQLTNARVLDVAGQRDAAITKLEAYRQTEAGRTSVNVLFALADLYRAAGDLANCGQRIDQAAKLAPDSPGVVQQQILRLAAAKQYDELISLMSAYKAKKTAEPRVFLAAASILHSAGGDAHRKNARAFYEEALRRAPRLTEASLGLALLTFQEGDANGALAIYATILEAQPNHPRALNDSAWILSESLRDYKKALELADRGVAAAPDDDHLRDTRGVILSKLGRLQDALKDFEKFAQLNPPDSPRRAKALLQMGRTCAKLKDSAQAKKHLDEALRIDTQKNVFNPKEKAELNQMLLSLQS